MEDLSLRYRYWDDMGTVKDLIQKWRPRGCETHKQYRESLHQHLFQHLESIKIIPEYGGGRTRADLHLEKDIVIELKVNFTSTGALQRAIGQVEDYLEKDWRVILVFCGRRDRNLVSQIRDKYEGTGFFVGPVVEVVEKAR